MNKTNFIILGTSKSIDDDVYYRKERLKMWGSLYLAGIIPLYWKSNTEFEKNANRDFAKKNGFDFYDIIPFIESNDKKIIKRLINSDISFLNEIISELKTIVNSETVHLVFNGKTSFYFFTYFLLENKIDEINFNEHKRKLKRVFEELKTSYGEINFQHFPKFTINLDSNKRLYILPNTSSRNLIGFDEFIWINTLKQIKQTENK
jgi:hypothetical protein